LSLMSSHETPSWNSAVMKSELVEHHDISEINLRLKYS